MLGQRTNETLAAARNLLHSKGNWPWANDIRVGLEALLASTLEGTALSKEFQLEAPTAWPENTVMWVFLPLGNTGISVPGPYPVADRAREWDSMGHTRKLAAPCFVGSAGDCRGSADNSLSFHKKKQSSWFPQISCPVWKGTLDPHRGYTEERIGSWSPHTVRGVTLVANEVVFWLQQ